jgi:hypothetical protein
MLKNPQTILDNLQRDRAEFQPKHEHIRVSLNSITKLLVEAEQERARLLAFAIKGLIDENEFSHERNRVDSQIASLKDQQYSLQEQLNTELIPAQVLETLPEALQEISQGLDHFTLEDKQRVIDLLNITGVLQPSEGHQSDVLIISGYIPTTTIPLGSEQLSSPHTHKHPAT